MKCFYCLNCPEFDELILRKIVRTVATRCHIFRLNAPNSISAGALPQTPLGELPDLLAAFKGPYF